MDILHDCLQKVSLNKYVTSAQMLIEPAMWQFHFSFDLDFGAVSEISDCPTNAGATTLDSDKSTAFESTWYAMLVDYRNSPITMKPKNND